MRVRTRSKSSTLAGGLPPIPGQFRDFFARLEIADAVIGESFPTRASEPKGLFRRCAMPSILEELPIDVYRAHIREVVETEAMTGAPLSDLSDAEILGLIHTRSIRGPLTSQDADLYLFVYSKVFPGRELPIERGALRMDEVLENYARWKARKSPRLLE